MKKVVIGILAAIGLLSILAAMLAVGIGLLSAFGKESVPSRVILEVDFEAGIIESVPDDPVAQIMLDDVTELSDITDALDRAAADSRVHALVARIGGGGMGLAHLQEIRDAVSRFREAGKPAYAFAETFGEFGPGNGGYYLATAFDRIYLQPSGDIGLTGMMYESMFVRGLLDKLDVEPAMDQRHEYKNAMNMYTERAYTEPHRRSMQELMDSQFGQLVRGIGEARGLSEEQVTEIFDGGPYLGEEALNVGLVDALAYRDEVYADVREEVGERAKLLYLSTYLERAGGPNRRGETIALIQGYGSVARGSSGYSPIDGSVRMGSDTVAAAFRSAIDDDRVRAIVFRVDSPGGSYVASDTIRRETIRARDSGKPVVVSMGNLAGSGGYFVAMDADKIVAQPGTITASIGVLGGKMLTRKLWERLGITYDDVHTSSHSTMWSGSYDYGSAEERFNASLDRIYDDFTSKVAEGRRLPLEEVQRIAKGRIWTGEDARRLGLVDELGGMDVALELAREAAGMDPDEPVRLKRFPARRSAFELFFNRRSSSDAATAAVLRNTFDALQPKLKVLSELGFFGTWDTLTMPTVTPGP